jgi:hypothetical protein
MIAATTLALALFAAAPATSEGDAAKAKEAFQSAQKLYKQARYPEAIEKFEEAYRIKPHPSIFFNIGRCFEQLNEIPKALRNYREYLKQMPDAKDKELVTDAIVNLERRLKDQGVQQLLVYSDPPGASVTIDGKKYGDTPASVELKPGNHAMVVTKDGFEKIERAFVMPGDKSLELSLGLKAGSGKPGDATATTKPAEGGDLKKPADAPLADNKPAETVTPTPAASVSSGHAFRGKSWIPAAGGLALLIGGGVCYGLAISTAGQIRNGGSELANPTTRAGLKSSGSLDQTLGFVLGGVGIAAVAAAGVLFFLPTRGTSASLIVTPNGGAAVVSGELP